MLGVDAHALVAVHLLDLVHEHLLGHVAAHDAQDFLGVQLALGQRGAGLDVLALGDEELLATRDLDDQVFLAVVTGDDDLTRARVFVVDVDAAGGLVHLRLDLRATGLEEFLDTGQTLRNIRSGGGATGVERTHRQLRAGLANRLGGDDADGLADVDLLAGGQ